MFKPILIAAALTTFGAATVYAQSSPPPANKPAPTMQDRATAPIKADKLIGRNVQNAQNETIGEIESIYLGKDGQVDSVIIGVGGFLGIGERDVRVAWKDLTISANGEKVTTAMTKDQLKAMPEYKYRDASYRGKVFTDSGIHREDTAPRTTADRPVTTPDTRTAPPPRTAADRPTAAPPAATATGPTRTFNADGFISTEAVLKASVRNTANENIGEVEDVYVDKDGKIRTVVVSVGGFLGMGEKNVALNWQDLQTRRDGNTLILMSSLTKDQLKAMPKYDYDRQQAQQK